MNERLVAALACAGAGLGLLGTYLPPLRWTMGPGGRPWASLRARASGLLGRLFDDRAGPREITYGEYAGRFDGPLAVLEGRLSRAGFRRNPLSRQKHRDGDAELGSWALRESPLADRQVHYMLFPAPDGVDVYAHEEVSSVNPLLGDAHFDSVSMNVARGVEHARDSLDLATDDAPENPPAGHWSNGPDRVG
jgi:hypothetical protein